MFGKHARIFVALSCLIAAVGSSAQQVDPKLYANMKWRLIGPWRGGRSVACSGVVGRPNEFYFGATGGGVWKSVDAGQNWQCVSDGFFGTASVGSIAVSASNPDVVYAGTGEGDIRGNISHGDGMYKSTDAGATWKHVGLKETQNITTIRIHPTNPNIVYAAALGHIYGPNPERGIYKSNDGGATWKRVLFVSNKAGGLDISLDASNPNVLFATTWEAWRTPYALNSGGPGSKLWKSTDGGESWKDISANKGLPKGVLGKIGVSISPANSKRVYAIVESLEGGVFRSDDGGDTWALMNNNRNYRQRAWYYTHIIADPKDQDKVYVLNVGNGKSTDGGKTFAYFGGSHSDNHDLWIDPNDPNRMINSNDGGGTVTTDGGRTWTEEDFPTGQFYHVSTDNAFPYRILGAQQDNSTVRIVSRSSRGNGITNEDWTSTAGGESGYVAAKPDDPDIVFGGSYGGELTRINHRTNQFRDVNPWPDNPMGHGAEDSVHRMQWTFPIVFSPHDPNVLYTCSQYVLKSTNGGQSWTKISPDLTTNDKSKQKSSGGPITQDNTSVEYYCTVFTVAESPRKAGTIWAGSDDGLVHVTTNGGVSWAKVTPEKTPKNGLCSMVEPSHFNDGGAYLAVDNHENDDYGPHIFRTRDMGKTWTECNNGIPSTTFVRVVREDPMRQGLLYAGTEMGMFVSFDDGDHWQPLQMNLPVTPVHDIAVKDNDIVVATHGRGFWVLDDASVLQQLNSGITATAVTLFKPRDAYRVRWGGGGAGNSGANPLGGIVIRYFLPTDGQKVSIEVADASGTVVAKNDSAPGGAGLNQVSLWGQYPSYRNIPGLVMWGAFPMPINAPPGVYNVKMTVGGTTKSTQVRLLKDPRNECTEADLVEQAAFARKVAARVTEAHEALLRIRDARTKANAAMEEAKKQNKLTPQMTSAKDALLAKIEAVEVEIYQTKMQSGQDPLNYPIKLNNKLGALLGNVLGGEGRPTQQCYDVYEMLSGQLQVQLDALKKAWDVELAKLNSQLTGAGMAAITPTSG